jgi:hypothetical protein
MGERSNSRVCSLPVWESLNWILMTMASPSRTSTIAPGRSSHHSYCARPGVLAISLSF